MLVVITGKTASGKTTLKKALMAHGFKNLVTYTTRAPRDGEVDGVDYHFITDDEFADLSAMGEFLEEVANENGDGTFTRYGSAYLDYEKCGTGNFVTILDPLGVKKLYDLTTLSFPVFTLYLRALETTCMNRALKRGDNFAETMIRLERDSGRFNMLEAMQMYEGYINVDDKSPADILKWALEELGDVK